MFYHKSRFSRFLYSLPVIFVSSLIGFVFYTYHEGYMWIGEGTWHAHSVVYFFVFMIYWCYFTAVLTDPGTIPENYSSVPGTSEFQASFCKFCECSRPPRAHHCRVCDRCVLRQDHHCPWIGNCVGIKNHRYFMQFIVYATLNTAIVGSSCAKVFLWTENYNTYTILGAVCGLGLSSIIGGLVAFNIWAMTENRTMVEFKRKKLNNIFDTGNTADNITQVLGKKAISYFLPFRTSGNIDGTEYPYRLDLVKDYGEDEDDEEITRFDDFTKEI